MSKMTARVITNLKPMVTGAAIKQLLVGDYLYGTISTGGTDIINFSHYYLKSGVKFELGQNYKASIGTNTVTSENEPTVTPPPVDPPATPSETFPAYFVLESPDGKRATYDFRSIV